MAQGWAAQIKSWSKATEEDLGKIFRESAQRVIEEMQRVGPSVANPGGGEGGNLPVDLGFLRASLTAKLNAPETGITVPPSDTQSYQYNEGAISLIILSAKLGDSIFAVYTAAYARRLEYGFNGTDSLGRSYNQSGYGFVRLAAAQWPTIVKRVVAEVKARRK